VRTRPTLLLLALSLALAASAAGCSSGGGSGGSGGSSASNATTTVPAGGSTTVPGQASCLGFRGVTTKLASHGAVAPGFLSDAQAEQVDCLDRITFFFDTTAAVPPGYVVQYQDVTKAPIQGCDGPITVPGNAFLMVTLEPAASSNPFLPEGERDTYKGNLRLSYGPMHHLEAVQKLCDGDGTVNWVIGLDSVRPFVVDRAVEPVRVSVLIG